MLCSFLIFIPGVCADPGPEPRFANVFYLTDGPSWLGTSLRIRSLEADTTVRRTDCSGLAAYTLHLADGELAIADPFASPGNICATPYLITAGTQAGTKLGVVRLPILAGDASFTSEAVFKDAQGIINTATIPALPDPLEGAFPTAMQYRFEGIEVGTDAILHRSRTTFIAFLTVDGRAATIDIAILDSKGVPLLNAAGDPIVERVNVDGFAWYRVETPVRFGSALVTNAAPVVGPFIPPPAVWAVAFVGFEEGASRPVVPTIVVHL